MSGLLLRRRAIMAMQNAAPPPTPSRLPAEYQEVEYIGKLHNEVSMILTDIIPNSNMTIDSTWMVSSSYTYNNAVFYNSYKTSSRCTSLRILQEKLAAYNCTNKLFYTDTFTQFDEWIDITQYNDVENNLSYVVLNGVTTSSDNSFSKEPANIPIQMLYSDYGTSPVKSSHIRVKTFTITENGSVTYDLVPCYRKSDNQAGLYDIARDVFLPGSDKNLEIGPDVT